MGMVILQYFHDNFGYNQKVIIIALNIKLFSCKNLRACKFIK